MPDSFGTLKLAADKKMSSDMQFFSDINGGSQKISPTRSTEMSVVKAHELENFKEYVFDDLHHRELLGEGSSGQVFLLELKIGGLEKVGKKQKIAGKIFKNRNSKAFTREVELFKRISCQSEHIVRMYGYVKEPPMLLMRYQKNGSLDNALVEDLENQQIDSGYIPKFSFMLRLRYIHNMCKAVSCLHLNKIVHRDLFMRNLLLSDDLQSVLLSDFGLAREVDTTAVTSVTYSPEVPKPSPPETWTEGEYRKFCLQSDIWCLGLAMWEILNQSRFPVSGDNKSDFPKNLFKTEEFKEGVSFVRWEELWYLMKECWNLEPEERPRVWIIRDMIQTFIDDPENTENQNYEVRFSTNPGQVPLKSVRGSLYLPKFSLNARSNTPSNESRDSDGRNRLNSTFPDFGDSRFSSIVNQDSFQTDLRDHKSIPELSCVE